MHDLWLLSISAGGGAALGLLAAGLLPPSPRLPVLAAAVAAVLGFVIGWLVFGWPYGIAAAIGGALGGFGAGTFAAGAMRRGATRGGNAMVFIGAAIVDFGLALIPFVGFLEVAAIPVLAFRARRRAGEKYAGLRTLAK